MQNKTSVVTEQRKKHEDDQLQTSNRNGAY